MAMTKTKKIILKSIYLLPFGFLFWMLFSRFDSSEVRVSIVAGIIVSLFVVFWNIFEYERFNDIKAIDFLESQHVIFIENNADNWNRLKEVFNLQIANVKKTKETENLIEYQIYQRITDSILRIEIVNDKIRLNIRRKYFNFIPDMAKNYKLISKVSNTI